MINKYTKTLQGIINGSVEGEWKEAHPDNKIACYVCIGTIEERPARAYEMPVSYGTMTVYFHSRDVNCLATTGN